MVENANGMAQKVSQAMIAKGNAAYTKNTPNTPAEGKREPGYIANLDAFIGLPKAVTN